MIFTRWHRSPARRVPRTLVTTAALAAAALPGAALADPAQPGQALQPPAAASPRAQGATYTVVGAANASRAAITRAITAAGGLVTESNPAVSTFTVSSRAPRFADRARSAPAVLGVVPLRPIGSAPRIRIPKPVNPLLRARIGSHLPTVDRGPGMDPLDTKLWNLRMIKADRARRVQPGSRGVTVGVLDTGIDARNPDLAARFSPALSRNFAKDIPELDGPCEVPSCMDPIGTDDAGHGTHVAGIIGAAGDGFGMSGVAPNITLVQLKGGHDGGLFFLDSVVNALTYAGDAGIDVVNMSFFVDPWLYHCRNNPADSATARSEQRASIEALTRAVNYARQRGVTLVAATGNGHTDLGKPRADTSSPNYPYGDTYRRPIDNHSCYQLPVELAGVIGVSAVGPSGQKADYSNYGTERTDLAAPGGWLSDGYGTPSYLEPGNQILSARPVHVLQEEGLVDEHGNVSDAGAAVGVEKRCKPGRCGYYGYQQGTSMAVPHVAGAAALVISQFGKRDPRRPGHLTMSPDAVERVLFRSATDRACPSPRLRSYAREGSPREYDAYCAGEPRFNGFYGHGILNADKAVRFRLG
jgi:subtilisin family serine protease